MCIWSLFLEPSTEFLRPLESLESKNIYLNANEMTSGWVPRQLQNWGRPER